MDSKDEMRDVLLCFGVGPECTRGQVLIATWAWWFQLYEYVLWTRMSGFDLRSGIDGLVSDWMDI